jgi:hypothetical protein
MKYLAAILMATALALPTSPGAPAPASPEDAKLATFFRQYLDALFKLHPVQASSLGEHTYDGLVDDISPQARAASLAFTKKTLADLPGAADYKQLSRDGQIDFEIFQHNLQSDIWHTENIKTFEEDPRTYGTYLYDCVYGLLTRSTLPKETNISNCILRIAEILRIIAVAEQTLTHPPKVTMLTAIFQTEGAIAFYQKDIFTLAGDTPQKDKLKAACDEAAKQLAAYRDFLQNDLMPRATGEWRIGKQKYDEKFDLETDSGISADQNYADAQAEFERVSMALDVLAKQLWPTYYPDKPLPPDDADGRREAINDVIQAINKYHGRPGDLVTDARATVEKIKDFIRTRHIIALPDPDTCKIIEMPEFLRGNYVAFLQNAPPLDPGAYSYFQISPPPSDWDARRAESFLEEYNRYILQILTIHEAYPGHYVQFAYANRVPSLIRRIYANGVFVEGWAVYGENNMLDAGYGDGDLRLRMMQLKFYLRAVANAILDHRMHCENMTDGQAMQFLTRDAFQSDGEARLKVIRAKQSSVQLCDYFLGRMAHYNLHQEIEREMGDSFNMEKYHEAVISHGSIPVKYLPELVKSDLGLK